MKEQVLFLELAQFCCGTRILRVNHGRDARATFQTSNPLFISFRQRVPRLAATPS